MPPRDAHVRNLDVSSFLGLASMVERRIGSTTRRCGANGGEFLQQGFAYTQSGGRERGGAVGRLGLEGRCVGVVRPQPSLYRGVGGTLAPPTSQGRRPKEEEWGASFPLLLEAPFRVLPLLAG